MGHFSFSHPHNGDSGQSPGRQPVGERLRSLITLLQAPWHRAQQAQHHLDWLAEQAAAHGAATCQASLRIVREAASAGVQLGQQWRRTTAAALRRGAALIE